MTLTDILEEEVAAGSFPAGAALVGNAEEIVALAHAGRAAVLPEAAPLDGATLFDLASLTKPLATGALALAAQTEGLDLRSSPGRFLPPFKKTRYDGITLEMLLLHTSGLPAWFPLYARGEGASAYRRTLGGIEPETLPGAAVVYSDLGILVLGDVLEAFFGATWDRLYTELVAIPAGSAARYLPPEPGRCAATEEDDATERNMTAALGLSYAHFRTGVVRGEVHDGNALRRGGVAAHAGLFGTAEDVWRLARPWLDPGRRELTRDRTPDLPEARGLAWQGARGARSIPEEGFSPESFGHTGFTGTSLWIDPARDEITVLLTNRVHPRVEGDFNEVRRRFHQRLLQEEIGRR
ncbi:MAG: beta-lactamase family protein [Acidobacteriota bacterium]|nr:beta-lactamase family protein [Acidobacteriota bacterium]